MSLYQDLVAAGCEIDNHESDLYVRADDKAKAIVRAWAHEDRSRRGYAYFQSGVDGKMWLDIPFAFDPWWIKRTGRA